MLCGFPVYRNEVALPDIEPGHLLLGVLHHKVEVKGLAAYLSQLLYIVNTDGDIGHKGAVHNVDVQQLNVVSFKCFEVIHSQIESDTHHGYRDLSLILHSNFLSVVRSLPFAVTSCP